MIKTIEIQVTNLFELLGKLLSLKEVDILEPKFYLGGSSSHHHCPTGGTARPYVKHGSDVTVTCTTAHQFVGVRGVTSSWKQKGVYVNN